MQCLGLDTIAAEGVAAGEFVAGVESLNDSIADDYPLVRGPELPGMIPHDHTGTAPEEAPRRGAGTPMRATLSDVLSALVAQCDADLLLGSEGLADAILDVAAAAVGCVH